MKDLRLNRKALRNGRLTRREILTASASLAVVVACAPTAPSSAPASPTPAAKGPVTLKFWYIAQGVNFDPVVKAAAKDFEDSHPSIKVELDVLPVVDLRAKVRPIFTSGGPGPDIVYEGAVQTLTYASLPLGFIDLTDRIKAAGLKDRVIPAAWFALESEGKAYGVPLNAFVWFIGYNRDYYEAAGIRGVPQDWDGLLEVVKKVTNPAKEQFGYVQLTNRFVEWFFSTLLFDSGVGFFKGAEDWRKFDVSQPITFNGPEGIRGLEYMKQLAETAPGGIKGNIGLEDARVRVLFAKGNIGHYFTHSIFWSQVSSENPKMVGGKNFDVYVMPKGPKRQGAMFATEVLGITKLSKEPDAAWEFVKFISDKWEGRLAGSIANVPVRTDATLPPDTKEPWLVEAGRNGLKGESYPQAFFPQLDAVREPLGKEVQAFFLGQKSAKQALDGAAAEAAKVLKK